VLSIEPLSQKEVAEELDAEYVLSRILGRVEVHHGIARRREGTDKIVSLREER